MGILFMSGVIVFGQRQVHAGQQELSVVKDPNAVVGIWHSDAPYLHLKDKYIQMTSNDSKELKYLSEEFDLAMYLHTHHFKG